MTSFQCSHPEEATVIEVRKFKGARELWSKCVRCAFQELLGVGLTRAEASAVNKAHWVRNKEVNKQELARHMNERSRA